MFKKLTAKLQHQVHPFVVLAAGLAFIGLVTALSGMWHYQYELDHISKPPTAQIAKSGALITAKTSDTLGKTAAQNLATQKSPSDSPASTKTNTTNSNKTAAGPTAANTSSSAVTQNPLTANAATAQVALSINGSPKGTVTLSSASNQCDVLTQALQTGLISSLDMRYSSQYGTYAVYVISNIGDSSAVWWTYTVNGQSPPVGCGKMPVHSGDQVNWQYIKE